MRIVRGLSIVAAVAVAFMLGHVTAPARVAAQVSTQAPAVAGAALPSLRCYGAQFGPQLPAQVAMHDQFQTTEVLVSTPQLFCVPAATTFHLQRPAPAAAGVADRLTCYYAPGGTAYAQNHTATNELGTFTVANFVPRLLCVPTHQE